jgi:homospermidine synthase
MTGHIRHATFEGSVLVLGTGSVGQGLLPLLMRHLGLPPERVRCIGGDGRGAEIAASLGLKFEKLPLTRDNYVALLNERLAAGDFLVNASVDVSSVALMELCQQIGCLYIDTCIEPWKGAYTDHSLPAERRTNYAMRHTARELAKRYPGGHTAVVAHGANPGLVSHFIKQALIDIARETGFEADVPKSRDGWARLMQGLGIRTVHVAERDTQYSARIKQRGEFVNTWSVDGFYSEGAQPAELGWGTHEKTLPAGASTFTFGAGAAIYLDQPGALTRVRSWTPLEGSYHGFLITHNEAISTSDYYTVMENGEAAYRPTCHYAYHPCDDAILSLHELAGRNLHLQPRQRIMMDEIDTGIDELGVLLLGHARGAYWYGSRLSIQDARRLAPHNNATSLQVVAAVLGGMVWAIENPKAGIVEAEQMDYERVLEVALPYLGEMAGVYSDWTPIKGRNQLYTEAVDAEDPWQFSNVLVK